jgi:hypothetical protein
VLNIQREFLATATIDDLLHQHGDVTGEIRVLYDTTANDTAASPLLWSSRSASASTTLSVQAAMGERGRSASSSAAGRFGLTEEAVT